jgi:multimeric flavodoxin WrbA/uncharacterized Zn finger protein (UPF0148 family)
MKVLALVSSARKLGNSEILAREMLKALPEDWEKSVLRLTDLKIDSCKACYACLPQGASCIIKDDFNWFLEQIKAADALIIAAPCYFLGGHTMLKLLGDRMIAVLNDGEQYAGRKCVAAITYGVEGWDGFSREAVMSFARFLHLDLQGVQMIQAANPGEVVKAEILQETRGLAQCLIPGVADNANTASVGDRETLTCVSCGSSLLQVSRNGKVRCPLCDCRGRISSTEGAVRVAFEAPRPSRYSAEGMREHGERLEHIKQEYMSKREELATLRKPYKEEICWIKPERLEAQK